MAEDRSVVMYAVVILVGIAALVYIFNATGLIHPITTSVSVPTSFNGEYTQFGLANSQLQSPFYSEYAISAAALSNNVYKNGSAVFSIGVNSTENPSTQLATIVFQLSGGVQSIQLTPTANFNNSAIKSSDIVIPSVEIVGYPSNQIVFGPEPMTIGQSLTTGAIGPGEYALEITTQNIAPITLKGSGTVVAGLFNLGTQLTTSSTGATSSSNFAVLWKD